MRTTVTTVATKTCPWCREHVNTRSLICTKCTGPLRWMFWVFLPYKLLAIAVVPVVLAWATIHFSSRQEQTAREVATHEKLLAAYMAFADTHSDYRHAVASIAFLAARHAKTIPVAEVRDAAIELDTAFDAEAAKLTPFEDVENASVHKHPRTLNDLWTHCFSYAYFDDEDSHWKKLQSELTGCDNDNCPIDVVAHINTMIAAIEQPKCDPHHADLQTYQGHVANMGTIWYEISLIITEQCADHNLDCKLPPPVKPA